MMAGLNHLKIILSETKMSIGLSECLPICSGPWLLDHSPDNLKHTNQPSENSTFKPFLIF